MKNEANNIKINFQNVIKLFKTGSSFIKSIMVASLAVGVILLIAILVNLPNSKNLDISKDQNKNSNYVTEAGLVVSQVLGKCNYSLEGHVSNEKTVLQDDQSQDCFVNQVKILTGNDKNSYTITLIPTNKVGLRANVSKEELDQLPVIPDTGQPEIRVGDKIRLSVTQYGDVAQYRFYDFVRGKAMAFWIAIFVLLLILVTGWKGIRSIFSLAFAFFFVVLYTLPAILDINKQPFLVAMLSGLTILYVVILITQGLKLQAMAALWGGVLSLLIVIVIGGLIIGTMHLTGLSQDGGMDLLNYHGGLSLSSVLLAAYIIGTIGILTNATISQAEIVFFYSDRKEYTSVRKLYLDSRKAVRDGVANQVYTIIFAYVGSALSYLLLFVSSGRSIVDTTLSEIIAIEIARIIVGSLGLFVSMPLTTLVSSWFVVKENNLEKVKS